ncbi:MAG: SDR family NAD(P)-dependent oxidoreductase, partial [Enterobacter sp.]|nr:SDR family NAD(P)-dependent oxidoreductase [Enterobacter sp.]
MKIDLTGKVALVTASTGGIGFAIARGLAESGAEVIVNGRSVDSVNKGIQALQQVVPGVQVPARKRVAIGPARIRVRSSTRTPCSGRATGNVQP